MDFLIFVIATISVFVGVAVDRWFEGWRKNRRRQSFFGSDSDEFSGDSGIDPQLAREWLQSMKGLTATVDDNVVRHATRVEEISNGLQYQDSGDSKSVVEAATQLIDANRQLQSELASAKDEIQIQQRQINEYMTEARTDGLTGLANRRALDQELTRAVKQSNHRRTPLSLLLIDVDHFKRFNDYHGHQVGDLVLQRVSELLELSVRELDFVARFGGEEFAVILPGTDRNQAITVAERIRMRIADDDLVHEGTQLCVTVSIGLAQATPDEPKAELVKRTDESMYAAKNGGRNCTSICADGKHHLVEPVYEACG